MHLLKNKVRQHMTPLQDKLTSSCFNASSLGVGTAL
jgi:hypothetical protein